MTSRRGWMVAVSLAIAALALVPGPAVATPEDDTALARNAVLKLDDLPAGWRKAKDVGRASRDRIYARISECKRYNAFRAKARRLPKAETYFAMGDGPEIGSAVAVYPTVHDATRALRTVESAKVAECLDEGSREAARQSIESSDGDIDVEVEVGDLTVEPVGDETVAYEVVIILSAGGESREFYGDVEYVRVGRSIAAFAFKDESAPLSDTEQYVDTVVGRLPQ